MELKHGVEVFGLRVETLFAMMVAKDVINEAGYDFVITSCAERGVKHSATSLHWSGNAFDMRTREINTDAECAQVRSIIAARLGNEFDVILEDTHIHIEFQPEVR